MGRRGILRAAPAPAGRRAARHNHHGRHPRHTEQAKQARVDGDPGLGAAEALADRFRSLRQSPLADAAQHQRRPGPGCVARPLPPARGRHRQAGEDENFRRAAATGRIPGKAPRMAFGRERSGGPSDRSGACPGLRSGDRLPRGRAGTLQRAVDDRAGPGAERFGVVASRLSQHFLDQSRRIRIGICGARRFLRPHCCGTARRQQQGGQEQN